MAAILDRGEATAARIQNYYLGGHDNTAADREVAQALEAAQELATGHPVIAPLNKQDRRFIERTVHQLAGEGIEQFLDLGCGLPVHPDGEERWPMPHEVAGAAARTVYVDLDPVVFYRVRGAVAGQGNVTVVKADLANPDSVEIGEHLREMAGEPVAVLLCSVLHYWDAPEARSIVAGWAERLPSGSSVVISCAYFTDDAAMDERRRLVALPFHNHGCDTMTSFFDAAGLKLDGPVADVAPVSLAGGQKVAVMLGGVGFKG